MYFKLVSLLFHLNRFLKLRFESRKEDSLEHKSHGWKQKKLSTWNSLTKLFVSIDRSKEQNWMLRIECAFVHFSHIVHYTCTYSIHNLFHVAKIEVHLRSRTDPIEMRNHKEYGRMVCLIELLWFHRVSCCYYVDIVSA